MTLLETTGVLTVGHDQIDNDHDEFIGLLNRLDTADNKEFLVLFQQLYEQTGQHFERENQLMKQFAYPGEAEHKSEHQRVLGEFKQFKSRVDKGLIAFGRSFIKDRLPQWFKLHVTAMDSALAAHISKQSQA